MSKVLIGCSGYVYPHWRGGVFYPKGLPQKDELQYYAQKFKTVELNSPFYHLPQKKTFENWRKRTPKDFIFAVKVSRFITHIKKLKDCKKAWMTFFERASALKEKLGPFLFQFPPSWKKDLQRVEDFLKFSKKENLLFAFEFRHPSWFSRDIFEILKKFKTALVFADSPRWKSVEEITADFFYIRMHGGKKLYSSEYTKEELSFLAKKIKKYLKKGLDVYVYFNNDAYGFAPKNAKELEKMLNL